MSIYFKMKKLVILGNGVDWCELSLEGLLKIEGVSLINLKMPIKNPFLRKIAHFHYSQRLNNIINIPLKRVWYRKIYNQLEFDHSGRNCLMIYDHNDIGGDEEFLKYVRRKNPNIVLAYIFTNFVKGSAALAKGYVDKLPDMYDLVFAFDPLDSNKYGFLYSPLIYDANCVMDKYDDPTCDDKAFYIGQAKDRLPILNAIFEQLNKLGIETDFNIVNVMPEDMLHSDKILYNKPLPYLDVLEKMQECNIIIDGIQGDSSGLTIKTCEAVCYNKKLITTNKSLADYKFYDSRYMLIIEKADDIKKEFFSNNRLVRYSDEAIYFFSGKRFYKKLWDLINEMAK